MELAGMTEGYSGSDIATIVKDAMMEPVRKCQTAVKFKMCPDGYYEPTYPSDPSGIEMTLFRCPDPSRIRAPLICVVNSLISHFLLLM